MLRFVVPLSAINPKEIVPLFPLAGMVPAGVLQNVGTMMQQGTLPVGMSSMAETMETKFQGSSGMDLKTMRGVINKLTDPVHSHILTTKWTPETVKTLQEFYMGTKYTALCNGPARNCP